MTFKIYNVSAAKNMSMLLPIVLKIIARKKGHLIKECCIHPQNHQAQAFHTSIVVPPATTSVAHGSSSSVSSNLEPPATTYYTPKMVQQMLLSTLFVMGFQGKDSTTL